MESGEEAKEAQDGRMQHPGGEGRDGGEGREAEKRLKSQAFRKNRTGGEGGVPEAEEQVER